MQELMIDAIVMWLQSTIKNPVSKAKEKAICLKLFNALKVAFAGDPDFQ